MCLCVDCLQLRVVDCLLFVCGLLLWFDLLFVVDYLLLGILRCVGCFLVGMVS